MKALFAASAALAAFAALAFANNVVAVVRWWRAFLAAGGDSAAFSAKAPGFLPWLDWSAVDYSAVTTLIPFLGFLTMAVSLGKALRGRRMDVGDFPFFRGSDQLHVALGLFGTLWGIIVIGYFRLDTVTMADLMQCLHTALFSTLMAVVWVFMVDRPLLRPYCVKLLERNGLAVAAEGDLSAAVEKLVRTLGAASDAFDRRQKASEEAFARRERAHEAAFERRLAEYEREFDRRNAEYRELFLRRIAELESRAAASEARLKAVADALRG